MAGNIPDWGFDLAGCYYYISWEQIMIIVTWDDVNYYIYIIVFIHKFGWMLTMTSHNSYSTNAWTKQVPG